MPTVRLDDVRLDGADAEAGIRAADFLHCLPRIVSEQRGEASSWAGYRMRGGVSSDQGDLRNSL